MKKIIKLGLFCATLALTACGGEAVNNAESTANNIVANKGTMTVTVKDRMGTAYAGAIVSLGDSGQVVAKTDASGQVSFPGIIIGSVDVHIFDTVNNAVTSTYAVNSNALTVRLSSAGTGSWVKFSVPLTTLGASYMLKTTTGFYYGIGIGIGALYGASFNMPDYAVGTVIAGELWALEGTAQSLSGNIISGAASSISLGNKKATTTAYESMINTTAFKVVALAPPVLEPYTSVAVATAPASSIGSGLFTIAPALSIGSGLFTIAPALSIENPSFATALESLIHFPIAMQSTINSFTAPAGLPILKIRIGETSIEGGLSGLILPDNLQREKWQDSTTEASAGSSLGTEYWNQFSTMPATGIITFSPQFTSLVTAVTPQTGAMIAWANATSNNNVLATNIRISDIETFAPLWNIMAPAGVIHVFLPTIPAGVISPLVKGMAYDLSFENRILPDISYEELATFGGANLNQGEVMGLRGVILNR